MAPTVAKDHSEHHPVDAMLNVHRRCWNGLQATCPLISSRAAAALTWTWRQAWRLVTSPHHLVMEMSAGSVTGTHSAGVIGSRWRWWAAVRLTSNRPSSDVTHWLLVSSSLTVRCWNPRQCITAFSLTIQIVLLMPCLFWDGSVSPIVIISSTLWCSTSRLCSRMNWSSSFFYKTVFISSFTADCSVPAMFYENVHSLFLIELSHIVVPDCRFCYVVSYT